MSGRNVIFILLAVLVLFVATNSLYVIKETERGVLLKFGEVVNPDLKPGLHVKYPFVNSVRKFDGRILTVDSQPERFFTQEKKALIVDSYAKFKVADTAKFYTATNGEEARAMGLLAQRINNGLRLRGLTTGPSTYHYCCGNVLPLRAQLFPKVFQFTITIECGHFEFPPLHNCQGYR